MKEQQIKKIVYKHYKNGFHCAESIVNTMHELFPAESGPSCHFASGFCGGVGKCRQDICGALSGGIIALGSLYGRKNGDEDIDKLIFLSAGLRQLFIDEFKSTVCKTVIENWKRRKEYTSCQDVTARTAVLLYRLIKSNQ